MDSFETSGSSVGSSSSQGPSRELDRVSTPLPTSGSLCLEDWEMGLLEMLIVVLLKMRRGKYETPALGSDTLSSIGHLLNFSICFIFCVIQEVSRDDSHLNPSQYLSFSSFCRSVSP